MIAVRILVLLLLGLSIVIFPYAANGGSDYGDIIKKKPEYKKITKDKKKKDRDDDCDRCGYYHHHPYYRDPYYAPTTSYYRSSGRSTGSGSGGLAGLFYLGVAIGESEFDYDDIDAEDASLIYLGYRPAGSRLGFELSFYDSGDAEVTSLTDIELEVETLNLLITVNSSINNSSRFNLVGRGGFYFADTTLSGPADSVSEDSNGFILGGGIEFVVTRHFSLRTDASYLHEVDDFANDESIYVLTLGGHFTF